MSSGLVLFILLAYFGILILISYFTSRKSDNETFFTANRTSPWYLVAFGMIGTSLSGVTFISIPGEVGNSNWTYLPVVMGNCIGYVVIALVLLPLFYKLNLVYNFVGYIFSFGISSLIIFLFFRQIFHLKIFTFALLFDIILVVYANGLLSLWAMISLLVLTAVIATIFAVKAIISNTRKVWNFLIKKMVIIGKK